MTVETKSTPKPKPVRAPKPAGAKEPTDHQPKVEKPKVEQIIGGGRRVTYKGATIVIDDVALNDFELLDDLRAIQDNDDASRMPSVLRRLAGDDGYDAVMTALRDKKTGRVPSDAAIEWVMDAFGALNPNS